MRGTWFLCGSWQPIEETCANQIESEHLLNFENQKCQEEIVDPPKGPPPGSEQNPGNYNVKSYFLYSHLLYNMHIPLFFTQ